MFDRLTFQARDLAASEKGQRARRLCEPSDAAAMHAEQAGMNGEQAEMTGEQAAMNDQ
ncbi:MAG TPA: hypothetical protein VN937_18445 [Blastocatellia bacterium]|nr:hypothetical protein [Blastocatellia bacterium]